MATNKKNDYPALTVNDLWRACVEQKKKGNGTKKILISSDDEGNGFHGLFYSFLDNPEEIQTLKNYGIFHDDVDAEELVILG